MRKYNYWHKVIDAHPAKKKDLTKGGAKLQDIIMTHSYPLKPEGTAQYLNMETGERTSIRMRYLGRVRVDAKWPEIQRTLHLVKQPEATQHV
jgi:hypothetical protein